MINPIDPNIKTTSANDIELKVLAEFMDEVENDPRYYPGEDDDYFYDNPCCDDFFDDFRCEEPDDLEMYNQDEVEDYRDEGE